MTTPDELQQLIADLHELVQSPGWALMLEMLRERRAHSTAVCCSEKEHNEVRYHQGQVLAFIDAETWPEQTILQCRAALQTDFTEEEENA